MLSKYIHYTDAALVIKTTKQNRIYENKNPKINLPFLEMLSIRTDPVSKLNIYQMSTTTKKKNDFIIFSGIKNTIKSGIIINF